MRNIQPFIEFFNRRGEKLNIVNKTPYSVIRRESGYKYPKQKSRVHISRKEYLLSLEKLAKLKRKQNK